jgi:hypothetical protein
MCVCDDGVSEIGKSRETLHVCPALLICSQVMFVVVDPWQTTAVTPRERVDVNECEKHSRFSTNTLQIPRT